jgi:hypothetical protein
MSERNETVARMLAADAPAGRDFAFQLAVMAKIEQRRFQRGMILNIALTLAVTLLLALLMPGLEPVLWQAVSGIDPGLTAALVVSASLVLPWLATRRA